MSAVPSADLPRPPSPPSESVDVRDMNILRKERELAEREVQLLRREVEMMREMQRLSMGGQLLQNSASQVERHAPVVVNEAMKAMLDYFDGNGGALDTWVRQLALLRMTYQLNSGAAKVLAVSRLRGQALKWFHSKPEHIEISVDELVKELRDMFGDRVDRIAARREFENRVWRTEETFAEYAHDKTILANLIRIDEEELIEYLIDGISDHSLWNHAKLQKFKSRASLLEAFKGVVLPPATSRSARLDVSAREPSRKRNTVPQREETWKQRSDGTVQREGATTRRAPTGPRRWEEGPRRDSAPRWRDEGARRGNDEVQRRDSVPRWRGDGVHRRVNGLQRQEARDAAQGRCYNCGGRDHFAYGCPLGSAGSKCFECREMGHVAANCPAKRTPAMEESLAVQQMPRDKYFKRVFICEREVNALIDTGSDLCLMRRDQYNDLGLRAPVLRDSNVHFRGIGANARRVMGEFEAEIQIDGNSFPIMIRVVPDGLMSYGFLIGTDFLDSTELTVKRGQVTIRRIEQPKVPHIFEIDVEYAVNKIDVSYVAGAQSRENLKRMINSYRPIAIHKTELKMTITVKDDEPVFQHARRLSPSEKDTVNTQVQEWLRDGIIQPSLSEYASPVVLVKKKRRISETLC